MDIGRSTEEQLGVIRSRADRVVPEEELRAKLERARVEGRPLRVKYGIDPTNPDIHIGHLVPCRVIRAFQDMGHTAVLIVGDYTARIGDPTGRNAERPGLSGEQVEANMERYARQLFTVVDESRAELHYQSAWFDALSLDEILRTLASFSAAQMLGHETFRSRLDAGARLSLHELMYPVLQAYDSVQVGADVEIGGSDQLFNCLCGRDLQRAAGEDPQVVVTVPLLMGPDGEKMSKSQGNHIPLSATADEAVGRTMSIPDSLLEQYINLATNWTPERRAEEIVALRSGAHPRDVKLRVAKNIAEQLRGSEEAERAVAEFERVFSRGQAPERIETATVACGEHGVVETLVATGLAASRSEARRLVEQGGVRIDGKRVIDISARLHVGQNRAVVLQVGKRRFREIAGGAPGGG